MIDKFIKFGFFDLDLWGKPCRFKLCFAVDAFSDTLYYWLLKRSCRPVSLYLFFPIVFVSVWYLVWESGGFHI